MVLHLLDISGEFTEYVQYMVVGVRLTRQTLWSVFSQGSLVKMMT